MHKRPEKILIWLPRPMGDAILSTPALRAIRSRFNQAEITFFARPVVREVLSPTNFCDRWLEQNTDSPFKIAGTLKPYKFTHAVLFKNSFASALACWLAAIPFRLGYARQARGPLLTDKLYPPKLPNGRFKPISALDYYFGPARRLGAETGDRSLELSVGPKDAETLRQRLPQLREVKGPVVILVPGAAGGPSKCWLGERFAQVADRLISEHSAVVFLSVAPNPAETKIANQIIAAADHKLLSLADYQLNLGELKALFAVADLVIANDTGPRHLAIALRRTVITLVGPNDPAWTNTGYENEIIISGNAPCAPCDRHVCKQSRHLCMEAITTEMVCSEATKLLSAEPVAGNTGKSHQDANAEQ